MSRADWARRGRGIGAARLLTVAPRGPEPRGGGGEGTRRRRDPAPPVLRGRAAAWWVELPKQRRPGGAWASVGGGVGAAHTLLPAGNGGRAPWWLGCEPRVWLLGARVAENLLDSRGLH